MRRAAAALLPLVGLAATPAAAQDRDAPDIVVTGQGLPPPPGDRAYDTIELDAGQLDDPGSGRVENALRAVAGLAEFRRSDARSANPTSQGVTLRGLGGNASSRALLLIDGVPQPDPFGGWIAWPANLPGRFVGARVTRGGGSGYAGPGALAGTIELISAGPAATPPFDASVRYGSRQSLDAALVASGRAGGGFATLVAGYARGDGFVPIVAEDRGPADRPAPYEQASVALRAVLDLGGRTELQTSADAFTDRRHRGTDFSRILSKGLDASVRLVGRGRWGWSALGYFQTRGFANQFASVDATRTLATPTLDQLSVPAIGLGGRIELSPPLGSGVTLRLGGDLRAVNGRTLERYAYTAGTFTRRRDAGGGSLTAGGFADLSVEAGAVTVSLGGRLDRWHIATGHLLETSLAGVLLTDAGFAPRSGWQPTGRAGAAWRAGDGITLRAAGYRGWRLPTLNELYRPFRVGADATGANAALDPETLAGGELGLDLMPARGLSIRLTGYRNRLSDAIGNVTLGVGPGNFAGVGFVSAGGVYRRRRNLRAIDATGLELDATWRRGAWRAGLSYALTDARVRASGAAAALDGLRPAQTAHDQASVTFGWSRRSSFSVSAIARYLGPQFEDDRNTRRLAASATLDLAATVPLDRRWRIALRAENVTGARVETALSDAGVTERTDPMTLWIGLAARLR